MDFQNYYKVLPEIDQIKILKMIIESYEKFLLSGNIKQKKPLVVDATVGKKDVVRTEPANKSRRTARKGPITVRGTEFNSLGAAFKAFGLDASNWYAKTKNMGAEEIESLLGAHLDEKADQWPGEIKRGKEKVIRRRKQQ